MKGVYYNEIPQEERTRIEKLQWLDEFEEFMLMQKHYFISLSTKMSDKETVERAGLIREIFNNSWVGGSKS